MEAFIHVKQTGRVKRVEGQMEKKEKVREPASQC